MLAQQLRSAYRGLDIEWWDEVAKGVRDTHHHQGSGHGESGEPDLYDDEDYSDGGSGGGGSSEDGSGDEYDEAADDELVVPAWTEQRHRKPNIHTQLTTVKPVSWPKSPPETINIGGGRGTNANHVHTNTEVVSGSASRPASWSLYRTVARLILPMVTCYLGGLYSDMPRLFS